MIADVHVSCVFIQTTRPALSFRCEGKLDADRESISREWRIDKLISVLVKRFEAAEQNTSVVESIVKAEATGKRFVRRNRC
jgi:hypothetical protein